MLLIWHGQPTGSVPTPPPVVVAQGGGTSRKKRKHKVIRFSDFESREAYAAALQAQIVQIDPIPIYAEPEEDEDEILLKALMVVLH